MTILLPLLCRSLHKSEEQVTMSEIKTKYIFVTGGVLSSLGKGITAASVGTLLKTYRFESRCT